MTVNQVHKKYVGKTTPFKTWINVEQYWFDKTNPIDYKFDEWINEKYKINGKDAWFNADGDVSDRNKSVSDWITEATDLVGNAASIYETYGGLHNDAVADQTAATDEPKDTRVFGMNSGLFWGIASLIAVGTVILIVKKIK